MKTGVNRFIKHTTPMKEAAYRKRFSILQLTDKPVDALDHSLLLMVSRDHNCAVTDEHAEHLYTVKNGSKL
ncbi:hypothetical protein P3445_24335, partial [Vibrio parahaemolyticus]|nr:hypothetical protein [Vibrio parahaemolyticus]